MGGNSIIELLQKYVTNKWLKYYELYGLILLIFTIKGVHNISFAVTDPDCFAKFGASEGCSFG